MFQVAIRHISYKVVSERVSSTLLFLNPHMKKSATGRSGERTDHCIARIYFSNVNRVI